jgi:hypothetical protein
VPVLPRLLEADTHSPREAEEHDDGEVCVEEIKSVIPELVINRFNNKLRKTKTCWIWRGKPANTGYGRMVVGSKKGIPIRRLVTAHRMAFELSGFPLGADEEVHHVCLNKMCVRIHRDHIVRVPRYKNPDSVANMPRFKTYCKRGHRLRGNQTSSGHCKLCQKLRNARRSK